MVTAPDDTFAQTSGKTPITAPSHIIQGFPILIGLMRQQGGCSELINFDVIYCAALHYFLTGRQRLNGWISIREVDKSYISRNQWKIGAFLRPEHCKRMFFLKPTQGYNKEYMFCTPVCSPDTTADVTLGFISVLFLSNYSHTGTITSPDLCMYCLANFIVLFHNIS